MPRPARFDLLAWTSCRGPFFLLFLNFITFHFFFFIIIIFFKAKKEKKKRNIFPLFFLFICLGKFMINFTFPPSVRPSSLSVRERSKKKRKEA